MKKIIKIVQQDPELMHLTWVINNICTNACSYCPSNLHNGTNHHYDWQRAKEFFKILFERYPKIHCSIAGGEPSVSPFFPELVKMFYDHGHTVGCTSNAAKPVSYWEEIAQYLNYICFSYHPEFPDKNFLNKVQAAAEKTRVTVRVMMLSAKWDHCVVMYETLRKDLRFKTEPVRILNWQGERANGAHEYTEEQLAWFEEQASRPEPYVMAHLTDLPYAQTGATYLFDDSTMDIDPNAVEYVNQGMTNFKGFVCEIGLKSLFINANGVIRSGNCFVGDDLGNLNDPALINWPASPLYCTSSLCHCSTDININKWLPK